MGNKSEKLIKNRSMPSNTIIPVLYYAEVDKAINWLCETFGFRLRWRAGNHRAQLSLGNGTIAISEQSGEISATSTAQHSLLVRVPDVQSHYEHSIKNGAVILQTPMEYPYGERQYTVEDTGGHQWTFSQSIADISPEEWGGTIGNLES
jgi:uncharacterized glyoxalase superfamily protein PhnB